MTENHDSKATKEIFGLADFMSFILNFCLHKNAKYAKTTCSFGFKYINSIKYNICLHAIISMIMPAAVTCHDDPGPSRRYVT